MRKPQVGEKFIVTMEIVRPFDLYQTMPDGQVINNYFDNKYWCKPVGWNIEDKNCPLIPCVFDEAFDPVKMAREELTKHFPSGIVSEESSEPLTPSSCSGH